MRDISNREDIQFLLERFYEKAMKDPSIGPFFTQVVSLDLTSHLPLLTDFWSDILLNTRLFRGNAFEAHKKLNQKKQLEHLHFERWKELFFETLTENFKGEKVELAKQRAYSIAMIMESKLIPTSN